MMYEVASIISELVSRGHLAIHLAIYIFNIKTKGKRHFNVCEGATHSMLSTTWKKLSQATSSRIFKGELNPKIYFSSFEHLGIVEQLYEVFWSC